MKNILLLCLLSPIVLMAQVNSVKKKHAQPAGKKVSAEISPLVPKDGFVIEGNVTGYADGTTVELLNASNGAPESSARLTNGKFRFTGKQPVPDFKVIAFNREQPFLTLFLDNSHVKITGKKESLESATITGSASHNDFHTFNELIKPYQAIVEGKGVYDAETIAVPAGIVEKYIRENPSSYISPLAIYRHNMMTHDDKLMESLFTGLKPDVQASPIGSFIAKQIADSKRNPIGELLPDFSQQDTAGNMFSLSSLRGKYVLVDFWASWCGPCRMENPNIVNVYNTYKNKNFTVLGVSLDKTKDAWIEAIKADNLAWYHVSDLKGWSNAVSTGFQIFSIPQSFLLDPSGKIIAKNLRGPALENTIAQLIK